LRLNRAFRWGFFFAAVAGLGFLSYLTIQHHRVRVLGERGYRYLWDGDPTSAVSLFLQAEAIVPSYHPALRGLAEAYFALYRDHPDRGIFLEKAQEYFERALLAMPVDKSSQMLLHHVRFYRASGDPREMIRQFTAAADLAGRYPNELRLQRYFLNFAADVLSVPHGKEAFRLTAWKERAIEASRKLLEHNIIRFEELMVFLQGPLALPEDLLAMVPPVAAVRMSLVEYLLESGRWDADKEEYLKDDRFWEEKGLGRLTAGVLRNRGRKREAAAILEEYLEKNPEDPRAHLDLAGWLLDLERHKAERADFHYRRAIELEPGQAGYLYAYGASLYHRRKYRPSVVELLKAAEIEPGNQHIWWILTLDHEALGDLEKAHETLRRALRLDPKNPQYQRKLQVLEERRGPGG
jgi:Tfp pilus assembly protein PilF